MPRIIIERHGAAPVIHELANQSVFHIGRAVSNDIVLTDGGVSRRHAILSNEGAAWFVRDDNSANGVTVNGARVQRLQLKVNDVIGIGECRLRFEDSFGGTIVSKGKADLPVHLTQILDRRDVAKLLESQKPLTGQVPVARTTQTTERVADLERENRLLTLLYQVSRALGDKATVEDVTDCVLELVLQIDGAERGYAMLLTEESLRDHQPAQGNYSFSPAMIRYRETPAAETTHLTLSQTIIRQVMESNGPLLVIDSKADERFSASESMARSGMQSAMCAPLVCRERLFGLLYVDNLSKRGTFAPEELEIFAVIAAQAGAAIDRVRAKSEIQRQGLQLSAMERFLSPSISRKIAAEAADLRLGGENQRVTLLFSDVRGFTTMAEKMAPREVVEVLNGFFERMTDVIFANDGTLDKYLGDGLMALFGAPLAQMNDAESAVRAAMGMQRSLAEWNAESGRAPLHMGIGIHTGEAVVGFLGTSRRMDYTAIGDTVNVAARLTAQAASDQILISAATFACLGTSIPCRQLAPLKLRGREEMTDVHEVLWSNAVVAEQTPLPSSPSTRIPTG